MKYLILLCFTACVTVIVSCKHDPIVPPEVIIPVSFSKDVQPILVGNCSAEGCHGLENFEKYQVLSYVEVMKEVKAGDKYDSEIYERITSNDEDERMPKTPNSKLSSAQIEIIGKWIDEGAANN